MGMVDEQHSTIADVRHHQLAVPKEIRVVRARQIAERRPGDTGMPEGPNDPVRSHVDEARRLVELLVDRDGAVTGCEEGVVGIVERGARAHIAGPGEGPDDVLRGRDDQEPIVVAVGDQDVSGNRARSDGRQAEQSLRRARRRR